MNDASHCWIGLLEAWSRLKELALLLMLLLGLAIALRGGPVRVKQVLDAVLHRFIHQSRQGRHTRQPNQRGTPLGEPSKPPEQVLRLVNSSVDDSHRNGQRGQQLEGGCLRYSPRNVPAVLVGPVALVRHIPNHVQPCDTVTRVDNRGRDHRPHSLPHVRGEGEVPRGTSSLHRHDSLDSCEVRCVSRVAEVVFMRAILPLALYFAWTRHFNCAGTAQPVLWLFFRKSS
mmetsp:Transcript_12401/g.34822  ORF Transcript_12401/g.34822 Transcript_12401/m.34822 type:complete len:229 (+) Transcript_12401:161-847(+)